MFLRLYDQYCKELTARAQQLTATLSSSTKEAIRSVNLKFCIDPKYIQSALALGFIKRFDDYESLTDSALMVYLESKATESKEYLDLDTLDSIVRSELSMDMRDKYFKSRMQSLFLDYYCLLRRHGLSWVVTDNQKVAVAQVLFAVKPKSLRDWLESDIEFSHVECRKDFKAFLKHAVRVAEAFKLVDTGPKSKPKSDKKDHKHRGGNKDTSRDSPPGSSSTTTRSGSSSRSPANCPHGACKSKGLKHWIRDCPSSTDSEKQKMLDDIATAQARDGPASSTRSRTSASSAASSKSETKSANTVGRMTHTKLTERQTFDTPSTHLRVLPPFLMDVNPPVLPYGAMMEVMTV